MIPDCAIPRNRFIWTWGTLTGAKWRHAGCHAAQIYLAGICTMCDQDFHSFRRDKERAGRMLSVVGIA